MLGRASSQRVGRGTTASQPGRSATVETAAERLAEGSSSHPVAAASSRELTRIDLRALGERTATLPGDDDTQSGIDLVQRVQAGGLVVDDDLFGENTHVEPNRNVIQLVAQVAAGARGSEGDTQDGRPLLPHLNARLRRTVS